MTGEKTDSIEEECVEDTARNKNIFDTKSTVEHERISVCNFSFSNHLTRPPGGVRVTGEGPVPKSDI